MDEINNKQFSHIKVHTQYSICEGALKIDDLKNYEQISYFLFLNEKFLISFEGTPFNKH